MAIPAFVLIWIYPVIFVPYDFIMTYLRKMRANVDDYAAQATTLDSFSQAYNDRMTARKTDLITTAVTRSRDELNRPVRVLEIGSGSRANFAFYPPGTRVICLDPNWKCESYLRKFAERFPDVTLEASLVGYGEKLEGVDDDSIDVVVVTLTLCTVNDVDQCLKEIMRVLRPGGKFVFVEHVEYTDNILLYWLQLVLERMWSYSHNNCRITRRVIVNIRSAGFRHVHVEHFFADEILTPKPLFRSVALVRPHMAGVATK